MFHLDFYDRWKNKSACWMLTAHHFFLPGVDDTQPWIHTTRNGHEGQVEVGTKNLQPTVCCLGILSKIYSICTYDQICVR